MNEAEGGLDPIVVELFACRRDDDQAAEVRWGIRRRWGLERDVKRDDVRLETVETETVRNGLCDGASVACDPDRFPGAQTHSRACAVEVAIQPVFAMDALTRTVPPVGSVPASRIATCGVLSANVRTQSTLRSTSPAIR